MRLAIVSSDSEANARAQLGEANAALISDFACGAALFGKAAKYRRVAKRATCRRPRPSPSATRSAISRPPRAAGVACGAVTWGYAAAETLRALQPDRLFERMEDIARTLLPGSDGAR